MKHNPGFLTLTQVAKQHVTEISAQALADELVSDPLLMLIDVREDDEWRKGHVPRAMHLGKGILEARVESVIPNKHVDLVLYCRGGFRSLLAAYALKQMGYKKVRSLTGGCKGWVNAGFEFDGHVLESDEQFK